MKISEVLQYLGMENAWCMDAVEMGVQLLVMAAVAGLVYWIAKKWLAKAVSHLAGKTATHWDDLMFNRYFFNAFALFIVPVAVRVVSDLAGWEHGEWFYKVVNIWLTFSTVLLISVILDGVNRIYDSYPVSRNRPIKVFIQVVKVFLYCVVIIVVISIIFEKDPESLLVGLSAFAAVLMLVFKDTILGFVAGVQLLANKMVNIGDWIVMPSANADGEVLEKSKFRLLPISGGWKVRLSEPVRETLTLTVSAGYGDGEEPALFEAVILQIAADLYEHREAQSENSLMENGNFRRALELLRFYPGGIQ